MVTVSSKVRPTMSVFTLVMINVIAIDSLRGIPMGAHYGFSLVFYYLVCGLLFFIPSALISAELATAWPQTGGIYIWVREAFGVPIAFMVSWIQWIYNICWYPTVLSFLAATLAYLINPQLANNVWFMLTVIAVTYWTLTLITLFGMRASGTVSSVTAIIGTLLPMLAITILGIIWVVKGNPLNITISRQTFLPHITSLHNLVLLSGVMYTLVGMELSATHAQDVKNPQRDYPRALLWSTIVIFLSLIMASLAVAVVVPTKHLDILTGLLDAFRDFLGAFGLSWLMPVVAILIMCGVVGGVGAWMIGPTRGLLVAAKDGCVPKFLQKTNRHDMPVTLLLVQGVIFSLLCIVFLLMPSVNSSFWLLSDLTAQLALSCYIFMFGAAVYLRYKRPEVVGAYRIPLGNFGVWLVALLGIIGSVFTVVIGYLPPDGIKIGNLVFYELFLVLGFVIFYGLPFVIYRSQRRQRRG